MASEKIKFIVSVPKEDLIDYALDGLGEELPDDANPADLAKCLKSAIVEGLSDSISGNPSVEVTPA